jgi:Protein of unknown function (DUF3237)
MSELTLRHEFTLRATVEQAQMVGTGPAGTRMVAAVTNGSVAGERVNGTIVGPGADWLVIGRDGFARVDVRLQIRTDDDALIYATYRGVLELNATVVAALSDPSVETGWDDQYFRTDPTFETGADGYEWLQTSLFVGRGRITFDGVEYEISRVE